MCYNYEDLEHSIRKKWKHDHAGNFEITTSNERSPIEGSAANDTSLYPGRMGRIILLGENALREGFFGLLSPWNRKFSDAKNTFNARCETILEKPTWRTPWHRKQRCIVESTGFYETDKSTKKKYLFGVKGEEVFYYGGLYNWWVNPENGDRLLTYAIITTTPNELVAEVHHRMPLIVDQDVKMKWMNEATPLEELLLLLKPFPAFLMRMDEVVIEKKNKKEQGELDF